MGITIDFISYDELINLIFTSGIRTITYANQHVLNQQYKNVKLSSELKKFDLIHPDGIGVQKALKYLFNVNSPRITGSDLYYMLFNKLDSTSRSVFIFGSSKNVLENAVRVIRSDYKNINIVGYLDGYSGLSKDSILSKINKLNPFILFVALGTPKQEQWIIENKDFLSVEKIIAIGGGLRVLCGDRSRGPVFMQRLGLEWLIRLFEEPVKNFYRYAIGIPLFLLRIRKQKNQRI
ncbi:WecB/TagA/CpsF family glycosyltransferase [soil metagenome]